MTGPAGMAGSELRVLGERLAGHLRQAAGRRDSVAGRQALVADLFAGRDDLLIPLKDVVSRPSFEALLEPGGARRAAVQRDALLGELQALYAPVVVDRLAEVLNGFLGLSATAPLPTTPLPSAAPAPAAAAASAPPAPAQAPLPTTGAVSVPPRPVPPPRPCGWRARGPRRTGRGAYGRSAAPPTAWTRPTGPVSTPT